MTFTKMRNVDKQSRLSRFLAPHFRFIYIHFSFELVECDQLGVFRSFIGELGVRASVAKMRSFSFLSRVARAARRHALLFIINEGKRRGNVQWEEKI